MSLGLRNIQISMSNAKKPNLAWIYGLITYGRECFKDLGSKLSHTWASPKRVKSSCWVMVALLTGWVKFWIMLGKPTLGQMKYVKYFKLDQTMLDTYKYMWIIATDNFHGSSKIPQSSSHLD